MQPDHPLRERYLEISEWLVGKAGNSEVAHIKKALRASYERDHTKWTHWYCITWSRTLTVGVEEELLTDEEANVIYSSYILRRK
jgi:hypothetical protein